MYSHDHTKLKYESSQWLAFDHGLRPRTYSSSSNK